MFFEQSKINFENLELNFKYIESNTFYWELIWLNVCTKPPLIFAMVANSYNMNHESWLVA